MEIIPLHIKDAYIVRIKVHSDQRGHLAELFNMNTYPNDINRHFPVQQVTWSANHKNSLRGMHISPYAKLLTCVQGSVYDVIVDMRPDSPSYLQWAAVHLTSANGLQALIPPHCGHGYLALEEHAAVIYCQVSFSNDSLNGIHISPTAKLVTCIRGSVYDVIVDMRPDSPSYLQWAAVHLTSANSLQAIIPPHCGHGYLALEEHAAVIYCQGGFFDPGVPQDSASAFDPILSIEWPIENPEENAIISNKDKIVKHLSLPDGRFIPHRKRILVIGSTGQVGMNLFQIIEKNYPEFIAIGTSHTLKKPQRFPFDMETDAMNPLKVKILLDSCSPHVIIIAAAFTNANLCESQQEKANKVNCEAVTQIAKLGKERNMKIVYISSDYVFNSPNPKNLPQSINMIENDIGLKENSPTNPPNYYGISKLNGEKGILSEDPTSLIIRTCRIYGPEEIKKNFVNQIVQNLPMNKEMNLLSDEVSCPTYNKDLCKAVILLIKKESSGIYHVVGSEAMSKYQWGLKIADYFKLNTKLLISKTSEELKLLAPRGKFSALSTQKFRSEFPNFKFHKLEEALNDWKETKQQFPLVNC